MLKNIRSIASSVQKNSAKGMKTYLSLKELSKSTMYVYLIQSLFVSFSVPVNEVENNQNIRFILIVFFVFLGAFTALTIILRVIRRKTCKPIIMKGILLKEY